jgi:hypothetical protein
MRWIKSAPPFCLLARTFGKEGGLPIPACRGDSHRHLLAPRAQPQRSGFPVPRIGQASHGTEVHGVPHFPHVSGSLSFGVVVGGFAAEVLDRPEDPSVEDSNEWSLLATGLQLQWQRELVRHNVGAARGGSRVRREVGAVVVKKRQATVTAVYQERWRREAAQIGLAVVDFAEGAAHGTRRLGEERTVLFRAVKADTREEGEVEISLQFLVPVPERLADPVDHVAFHADIQRDLHRHSIVFHESKNAPRPDEEPVHAEGLHAVDALILALLNDDGQRVTHRACPRILRLTIAIEHGRLTRALHLNQREAVGVALKRQFHARVRDLEGGLPLGEIFHRLHVARIRRLHAIPELSRDRWNADGKRRRAQ